ncbi:porin family protein [Parapedobacter koreensis]|uniref:Outer membrane protein beta-barrel domain-containing protein n=1 Tax=Parapedobacter koreensis TaxID=332977 RepID=A0A1H7F177_9SPHI|nr:porin family protein [Parapedobacter koreensis]SEK18062.1 Outer membrane protein beta-barrel domain-containing protein [Parapedobacter koreensis]
MKKITFILLAFVICGIAKAQTVSIGARGGLSIPNLTSSGDDATPLSEGYSSRLGPGFAVFAEFKLSKRFSLQPAIEYSAQGGKKDKFQALEVPAELAPLLQAGLPEGVPAPSLLYADFKSEAKFDYLLVPVLAKFGWDLGANSPFRVYVDGGPFVGFLLNAKQVTTGTSELYLDEGGQMPLRMDPSTPFPQNLTDETDIKDRLNKVNVGFEGNVGIAYSFGRSSVFLEGGGNYGFIKIQKGDGVIGKNNTGAGTVMLGYTFSL